MSYRTYINGHEWLGNNEGPSAILKELKRQGCQLDEEWCGPYDEEGDIVPFEINDLDGLIKATEKAILEKFERDPKIAEFGGNVEFWVRNHHLTYGMEQLRNNAYIFWSSRLLDLVGKDNYTESMKRSEDGSILVTVYTLKPGVKCLFSAY